VVVGATREAVVMAELLIKRGHELIVVERDAERIEELEGTLDCAFLHGDGSNPTLLKEADPAASDLLLALTDQDQVNILASLVGRSLGFDRVVTAVLDPDFEDLCAELELDEIVVPDRAIGQYLADLVEGPEFLQLRMVVKDEARFFTFVADADDAGSVADLDLPEEARVICLYREGEFVLVQDDDVALHADDEVVILTHSRHLEELSGRWRPAHEQGDGPETADAYATP
jgi:trk system potassium uptake protein TrkA